MSAPVFHLTSAALNAADEDVSVAKAFAELISSINTDHRRDPFGGWTASFPSDDASRQPDMWIVEIGNLKLWAKADVHAPVTIVDGRPEPCQPGDRCGWCGRVHVGDLEVVTLMLPEDY